MAKRLINFRGTKDFARIENRTGGNTQGKGIAWASCNMTTFENKFKGGKPTFNSGGITLTNFETNLLFAVPTLLLTGITSAALLAEAAIVTQLIAVESKGAFYKLPLAIGRIISYLPANPEAAALLTAINAFLLAHGITFAKPAKFTTFKKPCKSSSSQFVEPTFEEFHTKLKADQQAAQSHTVTPDTQYGAQE